MEGMVHNTVQQLICNDGLVGDWKKVSEVQKKERRAKYMGNIFTIIGLVILVAVVAYFILGLVGTFTAKNFCNEVCANDIDIQRAKFFCVNNVILQGLVSCAIIALGVAIPSLAISTYFYFYAMNTIANVRIGDPSDGYIVPDGVEILYQHTRFGTRERVIVFADKKASGILFTIFTISFCMCVVLSATGYYCAAAIWFIVGPPIMDFVHSFLFGKWENEI